MEDKPWFYDRDFWQGYLTMLAAQRFNRFSLTLGLGYDGGSGIADVEMGGEHMWPDTLDIMGWAIDPQGFGVIFDRK